MSPERIIAVIEDDTSYSKGLARLLGTLGFTVELYASAEDYSTRTSKADLLLVDIHLGGISGLDLKRRLAMSGSQLPVIFMSALQDDATCKTAMSLGCVAYLNKPFSASVLIDALNRAPA
jgi:FixJ family two-component response regulator